MRDEDLTAVLERARTDGSPSASSMSTLVAYEVAAQHRGSQRPRRMSGLERKRCLAPGRPDRGRPRRVDQEDRLRRHPRARQM